MCLLCENVAPGTPCLGRFQCLSWLANDHEASASPQTMLSAENTTEVGMLIKSIAAWFVKDDT